jgi:hypothetical protein
MVKLMDIEYYLSQVETIAENCIGSDLSVQDYIDTLIQDDRKNLIAMVTLRATVLTSTEHDNAVALLSVGMYPSLSKLERIGCIAFHIDIESSISRKVIIRKCVMYRKDHHLFQEIPGLFEYIRTDAQDRKDYELINFNALKNDGYSEIVEFENKYALIDRCLKPTIVTWSKATFPKSPLFIRVDPYLVYSTRPPCLIEEAILIPANPNWWRNLTLYNNTQTGASYFLEDCEPSSKKAMQFWEYRIKKIRRLDVFAKRNNNGNLSMMLEEISVADEDKGFIVCKCIHLDTNNPFGTPFVEVTLQHLDLAINVYFDKSIINQRLNGNLAKGKVVNSTYRIHLLRIEQIPFSALCAYARMFFLSRLLVAEWLKNQFQVDDPAFI